MNTKEKQNGTLVIALARTMQHIHKKSEMMFYQHGLTLTQFAVLEALRHKGAMSIKEIVQAVLSTNGNMTVVIRNLEKRGFIYRKCNASDHRSFIIKLSEAGINMIDDVYDRHMYLVDDALSSLTTAEKDQMIEIMNKLRTKDEV